MRSYIVGVCTELAFTPNLLLAFLPQQQQQSPGEDLLADFFQAQGGAASGGVRFVSIVSFLSFRLALTLTAKSRTEQIQDEIADSLQEEIILEGYDPKRVPKLGAGTMSGTCPICSSFSLDGMDAKTRQRHYQWCLFKSATPSIRAIVDGVILVRSTYAYEWNGYS